MHASYILSWDFPKLRKSGLWTWSLLNFNESTYKRIRSFRKFYLYRSYHRSNMESNYLILCWLKSYYWGTQLIIFKLVKLVSHYYHPENERSCFSKQRLKLLKRYFWLLPFFCSSNFSLTMIIEDDIPPKSQRRINIRDNFDMLW